MYSFATSITELAQYLGYLDQISYRFMAERIDGKFQITRFIIGPPATWKNYEYEGVIFVAGTEYGKKVADWLLSGTVTTWYNQSFLIMPMNNQVSSSRHPSHSQAGLFTLSKPFTIYRVSFSSVVYSRDYEFTSVNAPFFLTLWEAERHLLYDIAEDAVYSIVQTPDPGIYVYIEQTDAWLEKIHFSLAVLEVHLGGKSLSGTKLKIVGSGIQNYDDYPASNSITIPLPNGRPDYLKIALVKDDTWLDYYIDNKNFRSNPHNPQRTNVTFAEPEPKEKIRELIDRGEGKTIEFKAEISFSSDKLKWLKTVAAFANGEGGSIILGINDQDGSTVGINVLLSRHGSLMSKLKDAITLAISDNIDPVPEYEFLEVHIDKSDILVIDVRSDTAKCYVVLQGKSAPIYYIRRGATTRIADNNEVQELVRLKSAYFPAAISLLEQQE